ncbi:hypothetical protein R3W88_018605 [Solanum pinnatisectum]|uniref:Isopentenyltransferase n=1 Tax=Solanum pinnatisectum TaxID=50273 RepID=A0AAV9L7I6_9SOLN|nr:hypothetical protein R3W88_018605 [Solanum pinnatisectum]
MCNETCPLLHIGQPPQMDHKVVVVMGVTGAGKSRLSIDLATHFKGEIVNSDKIQVYKGLDIATNKITEKKGCLIPRHLILSFCNMASFAVNSISGREKLPIIVGGSNSFIEALVYDKTYKLCTRYDFCFLWINVSMHVLNSFLSERVDKMVRTMFNPKNLDYSKGIRKAIGVPEFNRYFRAELSKAINEVKINNCKLASQQFEKINRLINVKGWNVHRLDATQVMLKKQGKREEEEIWKNMVMGQSKIIVTKFLCQNYNNKSSMDYCLWLRHPVSFDLTKTSMAYNN